jgi:hypothetical protein
MKKLYGTCLDQDGNLISSQNKKNDRGGRLNEKTAIANAKCMVAHATITLCAVILGFACTWQHSEFDEGGAVLPIPKQEEVVEEQVTLKLVIHDGLNQTKAGLDPATEEKYIKEVDALVFEYNTDPDNGKFLYMYRATDQDIVRTTGQNPTTTVNIKLRVQGLTDLPVHVVVLANSKLAVDRQWNSTAGNFGYEADGVTTTRELVRVGNKIGFNVAGKSANNADPNVTQYNAAQPVPIPMWGHLDNVRVTPDGLENGDGSPVDEIKLLRMIAKIEIGFGFDETDINNPIPLLPDHRLGDIVYYNHPGTGRAIPHYPGNFDLVGHPNSLVVDEPSMPGSWNYNRGTQLQPDSILYSRHDAPTANPPITADLSIGERRDTIYSFEEEKYEGIRTFETCLVVQIFDENQVGRYYRIDFKQDGQRIYILRNHHYKINILQINSPGYNTPREALEGGNEVDVKLTVNVIGFDDGDDNVIDWEPEDIDPMDQ